MSERALLQASRAQCTHYQRPLHWRGAHKKAPCAVLCGSTAVRSVRGRSWHTASVAGRPAVASMVSSNGHSAHANASAVGGAVVAVVTPMRQDGGIDEAALRGYLQYLHTSGIRDIVVNGTTGEFWALTLDERRRVAELARQCWPGRLTVNVSACALQDVRALLDHCSSRLEDGRLLADHALLLPSFYYQNAGTAGVSAFLKAALDHARVPVILYNYPKHTGNPVTAEAFQELQRHSSLVAGIKNSEMPLDECRAFGKGGLPVLIGTEAMCEALEHGFAGFVTGGAGSVLASAAAKLLRAHAAGNLAEARELQKGRIDPWLACTLAVRCEPIAAAKAALSEMLPGFSPAVRAPLLPADEADMRRISDFVAQHGPAASR